MRIGITERGDAGIDLTWVEKLGSVDGAVIITKNLTPACINAILAYQDKLILHATCTGYGGTVLEPNVPEYHKQIDQVAELIKHGFPIERVVLRIDPIIPTEEGIATAQQVLDYGMETLPGLSRVRISLLDMYPHVRRRFEEAGVPLPYGDNFGPGGKRANLVNDWVGKNRERYPALCFESCCESMLHRCEPIGCVSQKDLSLLGLRYNDDRTGFQRAGCLCLSCKHELLENKKQCPHKCLYCYWQQDNQPK